MSPGKRQSGFLGCWEGDIFSEKATERVRENREARPLERVRKNQKKESYLERRAARVYR